MPKKWKHQLSILSKMSLKKMANASLVYSTYQLSRITSRNFHKGYPISLAIEPTTACNLKCPECPSGLRSFSRDTGNLKKYQFEKLIDQIAHKSSYLTFYFQGEPYLNPDFLNMVSYASNSGLITSTSTNAHFLDDDTAKRTVESGLDRIIISIDGANQESYASYRREGSLKKVLEGTKNLIAWKKKLGSHLPEVVFQFLVVKPNEHQIHEIEKLGKEYEVDRVVFKSAQIYDFKNGNDLIPEKIKYSRYKKNKDGTWSIKNKLLNQCWRMWSSCVITWDGDMVPCCFDKDAQHKVGNAFNLTFEEVWKGDELRSFRQSLLKGRDQIDICTNCSEGTQVWV